MENIKKSNLNNLEKIFGKVNKFKKIQFLLSICYYYAMKKIIYEQPIITNGV